MLELGHLQRIIYVFNYKTWQCAEVHQCYLSKQTACLGAKPEDLVSRCSDQQVFGEGRRKTDLQRRIKMRALYVQYTHIYMEQLETKPVSKPMGQKPQFNILNIKNILSNCLK